MQGCDMQVGHVHRHLGNAIFVDIPPDGLRAFQRTGLHQGITVSVFENLPRERPSLT